VWDLKVKPQCIKCIVNVRLREVVEAVSDPDKSIEIQVELLRKAYQVFREYNELTIIATHIFNWLIEQAPEIIDYYKSIKRESIRRAWDSIRVFREYMEMLKGYERFRFAVKTSIAGNILDTGVYGLETPREVPIEQVVSTPLAIDHTRKVYEFLVSGGKTILWLFDNAGESVYDTLLINEIRKTGNTVIGVVKEDPGFQNDLTISDAIDAGIREYVDRLVSTGYNGSSIHLDKVSNEFKQLLKETDLVIAKGMAHYEYISEIKLDKPIAFLLIPKCEPIAESLNTRKNYYVALYKG